MPNLLFMVAATRLRSSSCPPSPWPGRWRPWHRPPWRLIGKFLLILYQSLVELGFLYRNLDLDIGKPGFFSFTATRCQALLETPFLTAGREKWFGKNLDHHQERVGRHFFTDYLAMPSLSKLSNTVPPCPLLKYQPRTSKLGASFAWLQVCSLGCCHSRSGSPRSTATSLLTSSKQHPGIYDSPGHDDGGYHGDYDRHGYADEKFNPDTHFAPRHRMHPCELPLYQHGQRS